IVVSPATASAYRITAASTTPTAGANDQLTLTLVDQFGNTESSGVNAFSGVKTLTFSGLSTSPGVNVRTVTSTTGTAVNEGPSARIPFATVVSSAGGGLVETNALSL